jgi:SAM-dependent methyltransferase
VLNLKLNRSCPMPATPRPPWPVRLRTVALAPVGRYLSQQAAMPHEAFGRFLGRRWISETAAVNDITLEILKPAPGERICEIGFGPGGTLSLLAAAGAEVIGLDVSPDMVKIAARRNADAITTGRMELHHSDGTRIPLPDDSLDAALAVYNLYFWPNPAATLADLARTLRPGGRLVLVSLADDYPLSSRFDPAIYRVPTEAEAITWLEAAGFTHVGVERRPDIAAAVWLTANAP